jgi:tRNA-modifying protein YgfZ
MATVTTGVAFRPRDYVRVAGPDAADYLQRMLSNDVEQAPCPALLLTAKARVIAPVVVVRRGPEDFLLLTEPGLGERVRGELLRFRFAAKVEVEPEEHTSHVVLGGAEGIPAFDYGAGAVEVLDAALEPTLGDDELERRRLEAGAPRFGAEIDDRVLPAEAGLDETHVSFTKGCYPGQEPIARLRHRGHVNRRLRVLDLDTDDLPPRDTELLHEGKVVGRITSAVPGVALGYVRTQVPDDATLQLSAQAGFARLRPRAPSETA